MLQLLRLRVVSATGRFGGTLGTPEPPLQSYAASPAPRIAEGIEVTRRCVTDIAEFASGLGARTGREVFHMGRGAFNPVISDGRTLFLTGYSTLYALRPRR